MGTIGNRVGNAEQGGLVGRRSQMRTEPKGRIVKSQGPLGVGRDQSGLRCAASVKLRNQAKSLWSHVREGPEQTGPWRGGAPWCPQGNRTSSYEGHHKSQNRGAHGRRLHSFTIFHNSCINLHLQ
jgi:hypothetical protein